MLVSHPILPGAFARSVVLLCDYDADKGAIGVVLNGPPLAASVPFSKVFPSVRPRHAAMRSASEAETETEAESSAANEERQRQRSASSPAALQSAPVVLPQQLAAATLPVFWGGPVPQGGLVNGVTVLHPHGGLPNASHIVDDVYMNAEPRDVIEKIAVGGAKLGDFMVLAGCASWGVGQLEGEIEQGSWFVVHGGERAYELAAKAPKAKHVGAEEAAAAAAAAAVATDDSRGGEAGKASSPALGAWETLMLAADGEYAHMALIPRVPPKWPGANDDEEDDDDDDDDHRRHHDDDDDDDDNGNGNHSTR